MNINRQVQIDKNAKSKIDKKESSLCNTLSPTKLKEVHSMSKTSESRDKVESFEKVKENKNLSSFNIDHDIGSPLCQENKRN
jgi:hypothetical protein